MSRRQEVISRMLELQKEFIALEHDGGIDPKDYYSPEDGSFLEGYRKEYYDLAKELVDLAHADKNSHR